MKWAGRGGGQKYEEESSGCGAMGLKVFPQLGHRFSQWPGHRGLKDLKLLQLWHRSQLPLGFSPCLGTSLCYPVALKKKKKMKNRKRTLDKN